MSKEIKPEVLAMSEKLKDSIKVEKDGSVVVTGAPYIEQLPSNLTKEIVEAVSDYNTTFISAAGHAFGKASEAAMIKHKGIEETTTSIPMIKKDQLHLTHTKQVTSKNAFAKEGEPSEVTKFGVLSATYEVRAGKNKGSLASVRSALQASAMAAFSK